MLVRRHLTERDPERPSESAVVLRHGVAIGGGGRLAVMAGPCSIESASQIDEMADAVRAAGGDILRGGAFKPRTSPFGFAGVGEQGLEWLARAGARTNLPVVSEAIDVDTLDAVAEHSDIIQIGARNMHNFPLLFRAGSHPSGRPILLKRGFGATIEELLLAADYVLVGRRFADIEPRLLLCERGIRTFEPSTRFTFDVAALPVLRLRTHLPVIADPSHAAGDRRLVPALALGAAAAGASGLLLEAHTAPARAWCDGDQSLDLDALHDVIRRLRAIDAIRGEAQPPHASPRRLEPARSV
jgi:3-deoxy-7-phosphoheptulonate synthase